jgi:hypothetical protein
MQAGLVMPLAIVLAVLAAALFVIALCRAGAMADRWQSELLQRIGPEMGPPRPRFYTELDLNELGSRDAAPAVPVQDQRGRVCPSRSALGRAREQHPSVPAPDSYRPPRRGARTGGEGERSLDGTTHGPEQGGR